MSVNVSQIFVRYPDVEGAAELLQDRDVERSLIVVKTPSPWLAVSSGDNMPSYETARLLSRALEAEAVWYGLAGSILAYRLIRYSLGREVEKVLEPEELFSDEAPPDLPAYRDVEDEVYRKLRAAGIPADYVHLFFEEIGMAGGGPAPPDAALVRNGGVERFVHRVPRRSVDAARTLFDQVEEEAQRVTDRIDVRGEYTEERGRGLLRTLDRMCRRRTVPPGWTARIVAASPRIPELAGLLADLHSKGAYSFEFAASDT